MTQDDIIRIARESGFEHIAEADFWHPFFDRFAERVAAAERNKIATWAMEKGYATGHGDTVEQMLEELEWQIRERGERNGQEAQ